MQYDLTAREARILESESFLPLARQLQEMKLALEDALPWIETVKEWAQMQNMDIKTAGLSVAQQLRMYRQFGGLQTQIQQAQGELKMLNTQKQPIITTLLKLQQKGVKDDDIIGLSKILDLSRMAKEWDPLGPGNGIGVWNKYWTTTNGNLQRQNNNLQQPNNGSNNPGSIDGNFSENNGYGGNLSISDWIRLNLLKSTTTNMLNRMKTSSTIPR